MAQKVHVVLVDDLDGSEAADTVTFGLDGTSYEIDLSAKNADKLRESLAGYIGHARKAAGGGGRRAKKAAGKVTMEGPSAREIRDWARSSGLDVPDRGRVSSEVRAAFDAAH